MNDNGDGTYSFDYSVSFDGAVTVIVELHINLLHINKKNFSPSKIWKAWSSFILITRKKRH